MEARRDVFQAIADPTRRQILELLAHKPLHLNAIADNFLLSRQAISLHIKILTECGLISIRKQGRERYCEAKLGELSQVANWVDHCQQFWTERFNRLENHLKKVQVSNQFPNEESSK